MRPPRVTQISNAYHNQLETPLLFYVLILLIVKQAGHVWGLDALAEKLTFFQQHPKLRAAIA